jgi:hypothetical protein
MPSHEVDMERHDVSCLVGLQTVDVILELVTTTDVGIAVVVCSGDLNRGLDWRGEI